MTEELSREDYFRLIDACADRERLQLIIETLGSTGIRISELEYFTQASVLSGAVTI